MSEEISILHEIDDALRADKAMRFWQRYGKLVLSACAGIVTLTAVSVLWKNHLAEQQMKQTDVLLKAEALAADGNYAEALKTLDSLPVSEVKPFVVLQKAQLHLKAGEPDKAKPLLTQLAADTTADVAIRDSAVLRLKAIDPAADTQGAEKDGRPFAVMVREMQAADLLQQGKTKEAADVLGSVKDDAADFSPRQGYAEELRKLSGEQAGK